MGVRGGSALRGVNEATAKARRRLTCGGFAPERGPWPQGVPPRAVRPCAPLGEAPAVGGTAAHSAREARRCGHESREARTDILSHDNDKRPREAG